MNAKKAIREVAKRNGVSESEVRREIEAAVTDARNSNDPKAQAYWKSFPSKGEYPTVEEVITQVAKQAKDTQTKPLSIKQNILQQ